MNKTLNRYRGALYNIRRVFLTICLLSVSNIINVIAVDDDYYIPYTDTYGYTYDPVSGQFVKNSGSQDSVNTITPEDVPVVNNRSVMTNNEIEPEVASTAGDRSTIYYIFGGALAVLIMIYCWIRWV